MGIIYCDLSKGVYESYFDNGLDNGCKGLCYEGNSKYEYYVQDSILYITRQAGTPSYLIEGDYLINLNGKTSFFVPENNKSGVYTDGGFIRENEIVAISNSYTGHSPSCFLVYEDVIFIACSIKKDKVQKIHALLKKIDKKYIKTQRPNFKVPITPNTAEQKYYHPNTISKGPAIFITIAVMLGSLIFKQWYLAWIAIIIWYFHTDRP